MTVEAQSSDVQTLHSLGYAQELLRRMSGFSNFAVSFTIISILSGCLTLYGFGMNTGGPVSMNIGWPLVGIMVTLVGLAMAEVCSSYPTAGGLYYWSAKLAGKNGPAWSWFTGWFNLLGQIGVTAGIDFGLAFFASALLNLLFGYPTTPPFIILIYGVVLFLHGLLNTFGVRLVALLNDISVWWHLIGVVVIVGALSHPAQPPPVAVVHLHPLRQQHRLGLPAGSRLRVPARPAAGAVHLHGLRRLGPHDRGDGERGRGRPARDRDVDSGLAGRRLGAADRRHFGDRRLRQRSWPRSCLQRQIFVDAVGHNLGVCPPLHRGGGAVLLRHVVSHRQLAHDLRLLARRGGARLALLAPINKRTRTPTNSIWLAAVGAFILGLPYLWSPVAYAAVTSIAVIGLYIAYVIPILLRLRAGDSFKRGPWHLGRWSWLVGTIAVVWIAFIAVLFVLPQVYPITLTDSSTTPSWPWPWW